MRHEVKVKDASTKGAPTNPRKEICASGMGQKSRDTATKGAPINPRKEVCASGTGQMLRDADIATKDALTFPGKEVCASDMGPRSKYLCSQKGGCIRHGANIRR